MQIVGAALFYPYASRTTLLENYRRALAQGHAWGQPALQAALSAYNTGSMSRGSV